MTSISSSPSNTKQARNDASQSPASTAERSTDASAAGGPTPRADADGFARSGEAGPRQGLAPNASSPNAPGKGSIPAHVLIGVGSEGPARSGRAPERSGAAKALDAMRAYEARRAMEAYESIEDKGPISAMARGDEPKKRMADYLEKLYGAESDPNPIKDMKR